MAFAWRYVRSLAGPIRALEEGATRIGRGDLTSRIDVRTGDELQSLAEHFNQMAGQLQESYANLEGKVEERTQQLARSVSELEALGEVSRTISSTLDLRAVLDSILAHACQLADAGGGAIYVYDPVRRQFDLEAAYRMGEDLIAARARAADAPGRCPGRPVRRAPRGGADRRSDQGAAAPAVRAASAGRRAGVARRAAACISTS